MAALAGWHEGHGPAGRAARGAAIPAHARLETYSVLTRLPPPHRLDPEVVAGLLESRFPAERTLVPSPLLSVEIAERCCSAGVGGGAVYDALVALTAAEAGLMLLTRDVRATRTYRRLEIDFELDV